MEEAITLEDLEDDAVITYVKPSRIAEDLDLTTNVPEKDLYMAVIERASRDLRDGEIWVRKDAAEWFVSTNTKCPAFLYVATHLELGERTVDLFFDHALETLRAISEIDYREAAYLQKRHRQYWCQEANIARGYMLRNEPGVRRIMRNSLELRAFIKQSALELMGKMH